MEGLTIITKALHLGCCNSPRSASADVYAQGTDNVHVRKPELINHITSSFYVSIAQYDHSQLLLKICISYCTVLSTILRIFSEFLIFCQQRKCWWPYCTRWKYDNQLIAMVQNIYYLLIHHLSMEVRKHKRQISIMYKTNFWLIIN